MIRNATDPESTVYDTNRVGGAFQYGFTPAQGWELLLTCTAAVEVCCAGDELAHRSHHVLMSLIDQQLACLFSSHLRIPTGGVLSKV